MTYAEKIRDRRRGIISPHSPFRPTGIARRVCAYCGTVIEDGDEPVTHGICEECYGKQMVILDEEGVAK